MYYLIRKTTPQITGQYARLPASQSLLALSVFIPFLLRRFLSQSEEFLAAVDISHVSTSHLFAISFIIAYSSSRLPHPSFAGLKSLAAVSQSHRRLVYCVLTITNNNHGTPRYHTSPSYRHPQSIRFIIRVP